MKFSVNVEKFLGAISPAVEVATKEYDKDFDHAGNLTFKAIGEVVSVVAHGGTAAVDTSGIVSTGMTSARIGANVAGVTIINGHIRRLTYWPTRLGNEVLQRITQ